MKVFIGFILLAASVVTFSGVTQVGAQDSVLVAQKVDPKDTKKSDPKPPKLQKSTPPPLEKQKKEPTLKDKIQKKFEPTRPTPAGPVRG